MGETKNATGKAVQKPIAKDFIQAFIKNGTGPRLTSVITPDIKNAINNAIKNGNKTLGLTKAFLTACIKDIKTLKNKNNK